MSTKEIVAVGVVSLRGLDVDGYSEGQWRLIGETDDDADTTWAQARQRSRHVVIFVWRRKALLRIAGRKTYLTCLLRRVS